MTGGYLIGLDLGTTNIKGVLVSSDGRVIRETSSAVIYDRQPGGVVEYDASAFFLCVASALKELADERVTGVSMVSASGNTVLLDNEMKPLRPAINWMDRRFSREAEEVLGNPYELYETTGWNFSNSFPLAHLSWLKLNEPENYRCAHRVCMVTDYVNYMLTGEFKTNPSTATTFYLQDQKKIRWEPSILSKLEIPEDRLPEIIPSGRKIGEITKEATIHTGLKPGTPVIAGSFDHPGAARGLGILEEGSLLLSCGTSWVGFYLSKSRDRLLALDMLIDPFLNNEGCWAGMFSLPRIGSNIDMLLSKWITDTKDRYEKFNEMSALSTPGAGGLSVNPMEDTEKDLSSYKKEDICRAIMEGTALLMKDKTEFFHKNGLAADKIVMAGGPTRSKLWMDILCDILGVRISIGGSHAGASGAAVMAGIGAGIYKDEHDAAEKMKTGG